MFVTVKISLEFLSDKLLLAAKTENKSFSEMSQEQTAGRNHTPGSRNSEYSFNFQQWWTARIVVIKRRFNDDLTMPPVHMLGGTGDPLALWFVNCGAFPCLAELALMTEWLLPVFSVTQMSTVMKKNERNTIINPHHLPKHVSNGRWLATRWWDAQDFCPFRNLVTLILNSLRLFLSMVWFLLLFLGSWDFFWNDTHLECTNNKDMNFPFQ